MVHKVHHETRDKLPDVPTPVYQPEYHIHVRACHCLSLTATESK